MPSITTSSANFFLVEPKPGSCMSADSDSGLRDRKDTGSSDGGGVAIVRLAVVDGVAILYL